MTPHNEAALDDYADIVIAPGDPLRAKLIAENLLKDYKLVNSIRNCFGYTGYYKNKRISIQATGMGQPSLGIYVTELYQIYNVKCVIRLGTCGAFFDNINIGDLVIPLTSSTDSNMINDQTVRLSPCCSIELLKIIMNNEQCCPFKIWYGQIHSSDLFYQDDLHWWQQLKTQNILAVDMETAYLYYLANKLHKSALTINMVSNNLATNVFWTNEDKNKQTLKTAEFIMETL